MLTAMRRLASTWFAKALFLLLILSFGIWGIEDVIRNFGRETAVARVGDERIELTEAQMALRREQSRLQRQFGSRFEVTPQIRATLAVQALDGLIAERALRIEAQRLGVVVPPAALRDYVFAIPTFQTAGQFDRRILDMFLRQNDLNEAGFLALVTADLARQQLVGVVRNGAAAPDLMRRPLLQWQAEQRVAELVELPLLSAPQPEPPTEAQLVRFHENNPERFSAPEYREASVAVLSAASLVPEVEVPEAALREAYDVRRGQFETPERRVIQQALLPTEEAAKRVAESWPGDASFGQFAALAAAAGGTAADLGEITRDGLPFAELAQAAFGLPVGGTSAPVRSPFGWHLLHVRRIEPGTVRGFDEVKGAIREELALERAADLAYERANRVEDALAGGATLAEVAARFNLPLARLTTDAAGRDPAGALVVLPVPAPQRPEVLRTIFGTDPGRAPRLDELGQGGFFAVEVRGVTPAALRPFAAVETEVRRAWVLEQQRRAQEERAAALLAAVRGGASLAAAAEAAGLRADRIGPFPRVAPEGAPPGLMPPRELIDPLFAERVGQATMTRTQAGFAVAQLLEIVPANPDADVDGMNRVRSEVEQAMQEDLEAQFNAALRARARVRINPDVLRQVAGN